MKTSAMYITLLSAVLLVFSCANAGKNGGASNGDDNTATPPAVEWEMLASGTQCAIETAKQVVISSEEEMRAIWQEAFSGIDMAPDMPVVDFEKYRVVALFMGMVRKGGHQIDIKSATNAGVVVQHIKPGPNCMAAAVIEFPFAFARVTPFTSEQVAFEVVEVEQDCE